MKKMSTLQKLCFKFLIQQALGGWINRPKNVYKRGGKGGSDSLWELTAGAEKVPNTRPFVRITNALSINVFHSNFDIQFNFVTDSSKKVDDNSYLTIAICDPVASFGHSWKLSDIHTSQHRHGGTNRRR